MLVPIEFKNPKSAEPFHHNGQAIKPCDWAGVGLYIVERPTSELLQIAYSELFREFLKLNDIYDKYWKNTREASKSRGSTTWAGPFSYRKAPDVPLEAVYGLRPTRFPDAIVKAFSWDDSPEGRCFWERYSRCWITYLEQVSAKKDIIQFKLK